MVENFGKNMPAGTEAMMTAWKQVISAGSETNDTARQSAKRAALTEAAGK